MERLNVKLPAIPNRKDVITTVAQSAVIVGTIYAINPIVERLKIPIGSGLEKPKLVELPFTTTVAPIVEEAVFRSFPRVLIKNKNTNWRLGLPVTAVFALSHNFRRDGSFETRKIPLYQFAEGLFLWRIMSKKGYTNAVIGHATINLLWHGIQLAQDLFSKKDIHNKNLIVAKPSS